MLEKRLNELAQSDIYPFHMPGHKRRAYQEAMDPYAIDITEIEGFDNLHDARGILREEQEKAAKVYGSKKCYYLVNGSTCGILVAVSAAVRAGGRILLARDCHRSVYNAIYLRQLVTEYIYPAPTTFGLTGQVLPEDVGKKLDEYPDIQAVVLTSPTYDGIVSDIGSIARVVHERGIPLIVDEAHGAHLGFHETFPQNATRLGADAVVMSIHKTLPAFTQTALLHLCSDRIASAEVDRFLGIYETSSPSYVLMAGISRCVDLLCRPSAGKCFDSYAKKLAQFREMVNNLRHIRVLDTGDFTSKEAYAFDPGKLVLYTADGMTGVWLKDALLRQYHIQTEMAGINYVLAMTSLADSREGFTRLAEALRELDETWKEVDSVLPEKTGYAVEKAAAVYGHKEKCIELSEAAEAEKELVSFEAADGQISGDYVCLYPPGTPILVPGEKIMRHTLEGIRECRKMGLAVEDGMEDAIQVVKRDKI